MGPLAGLFVTLRTEKQSKRREDASKNIKNTWLYNKPIKIRCPKIEKKTYISNLNKNHPKENQSWGFNNKII